MSGSQSVPTSVAQLSASTQDYLKVVWASSEWSDEPVTASRIAKETGLRQSTVSDAVRKLSEQGLVEHAPYGSVDLTEAGSALAVAMIRRHRLIETFLVTTLGYTWDQVHDEAENLEHAVSDFLVERIDALLGYPARDPHGDPIPAADGSVVRPEAIPLTQLNVGESAVIERIADADAKLLKFLHDNGLTVGTTITIGEGAPFSGAVDVHTAGKASSVALGPAATDAVFVSATGGAGKSSRA